MSAMESDQSFSGDSNSSSSSSSASSDSEEEVLEPVKILGHTLQLPQEICEDYSVFKEFFSMRTWEALEDKHRQHLLAFLPKFTANEEEERDKTIKMLFNREPFHFTSPLNDFYNNLRQGNYRPDIAKMKKFLLKARAKQQRHKIKSYYAKLLPEVLISRERLLVAARAAPPGPAPMLPDLPPKPSTKNSYHSPHVRARQRYFEELSAIRSEVGAGESEDENYPEGPPVQPSRKRSRIGVTLGMDGGVAGTLGGNDPASLSSLECLKNVLAAHRTRRQYRENHPELNTTGITLDDIRQRVALVNGTKKLMFGGHKGSETVLQKLRRSSKKDNSKHIKSSEPKSATKAIKEDISLESVENKPLLPKLKIKCEQEESDSESSSFVDPVSSPKASKKRKTPDLDVKQEVDIKYPDSTNIKLTDGNLDCVVKEEPQDVTSLNPKAIQPVPIKLEDLDGIDMMALPIELADDAEVAKQLEAQSSAVDLDESLTETTYANFLCLVRALFPARAAHRASKQQLHARCAAVMRSPIAPLNTWYSLSNDWCSELDSALEFLAGERGPHPDDYVPYLQFVPEAQVYQWIGAGRDCDSILGRLCERWLRSVSPLLPANDLPPPKYPTSWIVRSPTTAEVAEFRLQERKRFASAAKPFTYVQHGYRAVVGPCARGPVACSSQSSILSPDRPRPATFMALLRDAVARLPNGEGSKADILVLLKMSQYISTNNDQVLLSAISSALDRLHSAKRDPFVKYDQRSATWTCLHRNRTEEDWVKTNRVRVSKSAAPAVSSAKESLMTSCDMDLDVAVEEVIENASDSDVDVDDSSDTSVPHLSSAQLLRQATQAKLQQVTIGKPKAKITPIPKPKPAVASPPKPTSQTKPNVSIKTTPQTPKHNPISHKTQSPKSNPKAQKPAQSPKIKTVNTQSAKVAQIVKQVAQMTQNKQVVSQLAQNKQHLTQLVQKNVAQLVQSKQNVSHVGSASKTTSIVAPPSKSALIKQRPLQKIETSVVEQLSTAAKHEVTASSTVQPVVSTPIQQIQAKMAQATRSLLLRPPTVQTTVTANTTVTGQVAATSRRSVVRVLSPATSSSGKSLISPQALLTPTTTTTAKKRVQMPSTVPVTTSVQNTSDVTSVVSSTQTVVSSTRTVQLPGGRTVQLANQTVHLPGGQAVQLTSGHTLQLSSLQLPTHSVRLPSGQTIQLASGQTVRAVSSAVVKNPNPRSLASAPAVVKNTTHTSQLSQQALHTPVSTVQLAGQTVQIGGQSVQLAGQSVQLTGQSVQLGAQSVQLAGQNVQLSGQSVQLAGQSVQLAGQSVQLAGQSVQLAGQGVQLTNQSVQLTGHTVKLPSGQSVQVASQSVQLPSGQTVHLASGQNIQTLQLAGQSMSSGQQNVHLGSQTVQLAGSQTVQLPSGQTIQLSSGQTVQLSSGQTLQLSGQTVHLANKVQTQTPVGQHVVRSQAPEKPTQPIVANLLTNSQGQMISLESMIGGTRTLQLSGIRPQGQKTLQAVQGVSKFRVMSATGARVTRPLILTAAKPLHNIILQQSDGTAIRVTSSGSSSSTQAIVLSNIGGQTATTSATTAPVLKLQQVNALQQVKLPQGIRIHQAGTSVNVPTSSAPVRSVLMDGQQLKLVGGRHVLARLLRPTQPQ